MINLHNQHKAYFIMGNIQEVLRALNTQQSRLFKEATQKVLWSQEEIDHVWVEACKTLKPSLFTHVLTLGTPGQNAFGESLVLMIRGDKDAQVSTYLAHLEDINWQDAHGRTLLSHAVEDNKKKSIATLLSRGADITLVDTQGLPPIYYAMAARRTTLATQLLDYGVTLEGALGRMIIDAAPTKELSRALTSMFIAQRSSSMTGAQFVEKWGHVERTHEAIVWPEVSDTGERFMKGEMYTVGYYPAGEDPTQRDDLDWEAIDAAKTLAEALARPLRDSSGAEAPRAFHPFFIPSLGHAPGVVDFDAKMTQESLDTGPGTYSKHMEVLDQGPGGFDASRLEEEVRQGTLSPAQHKAYQEVIRLFGANCKHVREHRLYTDLGTFPVIIGGLDEYYNFVGVIGEAVWT